VLVKVYLFIYASKSINFVGHTIFFLNKPK